MNDSAVAGVFLVYIVTSITFYFLKSRDDCE